MKRIVLRRMLALVPLVWLVATLTFVVVQAAPGSYADTIDNPRLSPETRELIRARYGLDRPPLEQYLSWLGAVATGDLGTSFMYKQPVSAVLARALPPTLLLAGAALLFDLVFGLALAVAATRRPYGWVDRVTTVLSLGLYGVPSFWLAGLLILVFSLLLGWFPASHMHSVDAAGLSALPRLADLLRHLFLPALCLGLVGAAGTARYLRATLIDVRSSRFMLAARARHPRKTAPLGPRLAPGAAPGGHHPRPVVADPGLRLGGDRDHLLVAWHGSGGLQRGPGA